MACEQGWLEILSAWQDGEASGEEIARVRAHLAGCGRCRAMRSEIGRLHDAFGPLRTGCPAVASSPSMTLPGRARRSRRWQCAGAIAAALVALLWSHDRHRTAVADELEVRHLTAFARTTPCEFTSSDPTAVRTWVEANVGYEVEVPEIPGATLLGARRCTVHGGVTASLLYRRGAEPVSLFLPRTGTSAQTEAVRMSRGLPGCTVGRLGAVICARPGLFAVAETRSTALAAIEAF